MSEKKKTLHLFRVPNEWPDRRMNIFIEIIRNSIENPKKKGLIFKKEVEYTAISIEEGDKFTVIMKGDVYNIE